MTDYALTDILTERKWKCALFTTYALSLTFFESYVLRYLHQQGCRDIYLIVDADGYKMSLSERRSNRVGQEYRLIPVALEEGIFHPKCIYLSGNEGDILAVGSGNMTFGGFGRNLEVFEIFDQREKGQVFLDFAKFLELLDKRKDFIVPEKSWIELFSSLASKSIGKDIENNEPRLLNCVAEPIIDQVVNISSKHQLGKEVTILSPFHDPDGIAVRNLAKRLSAKKIRVALPQNQKTTFPFPKTKDWGLDVSAVKPVTEYSPRSLHAKWTEIDLNDGKKLTLTGSINATSQSLCSNKNIEVGVMRLDEGNVQWMNWDDAPIPDDIAAQTFRKSGLGKKCLIHANVRNDGVIAGQIIALFDKSGEWEGYLENSAADQTTLKVSVNEEGKFKQIIKNNDNILTTPGLQITLVKGDKYARGWVNQEDILRLSREQRSIIKFINCTETLDDEIALLDYLALSASRHLSTFSRPISIKQHISKTNNKDGLCSVHINLSDIAPDNALSPLDNDFATHDHSLDKNLDIFAQLRLRLLGRRSSADDSSKTISKSGIEDVDSKDLKEKKSINKPVMNSIDRFDHCIKECLVKTPNIVGRRAAFAMWYEVKLFMLQRHQEIEKGLEFIWDWFQKVCSSKLISIPPESLEQHLFTVAAILAYQAKGSPDKEKDLIEIHECLERFCGGEISRALADEVLLDYPDVGFSSFLLAGKDISLRNDLHLLLDVITLRKMLSHTLNQYENDKVIDESSLLFRSKIGKEFLAMLKKGHKKQFYIVAIKDRLSICPCCYMTLPIQAQLDLKHCRIAKCTSCSKFIVNLHP